MQIPRVFFKHYGDAVSCPYAASNLFFSLATLEAHSGLWNTNPEYMCKNPFNDEGSKVLELAIPIQMPLYPIIFYFKMTLY